MNKTKSIAIIIALSVIVLISLFGKEANEKKSIIAGDTEASMISRVDVEEEQIIPTTETDFILPSQEIEDTLNTESLITETEEPETEWIPNVEEINIHVTTQKDIDKISELTTLKSLYIRIPAEGIDLSPLGKLNNLRKLTIIPDIYSTMDLSFTGQLASLEYLELDKFCDIDDLAFLERIPTLSEIYIEHVEDADLSYLQNNHELRRIHICGGNIRHMECLGQLEKVEWVYLMETHLLYGKEKNEREVLNLEVMSNMKSLNGLSLTSVRVEDVSPLRNLDELQFVYLEDTGIENIEPLKDLKSLRTLFVMGNESELVKEQAETYFNHVPNVYISEKLSPG